MGSPLYFVMFVTLAIWLGLFCYLWRLDARVKDLQKQFSQSAGRDPEDAPAAVMERAPGGAARE